MTSGSWRTMWRRPVREGQPDLRIHVDLVDAVHLIFDRVFDGDDLLVGLVDALERRIERGRFAAAGGAGDQKNAVRQGSVMLHARQHVMVEPQAFEIVEIAGGAVEQTHDDAFAVERGQSGNAQVDFAAQRLDLDAAVLRQAAFGDIQAGHQLHARNDGGLQLARRRVLTHQHAVNAVADAKFFFERLDVDIAGALFDGLRDHGVHQTDDRRFAGHVAKVFQVFVGLADRQWPSRFRSFRFVRSSGRWRREFPARRRARAAPRGQCTQPLLNASQNPGDRPWPA